MAKVTDPAPWIKAFELTQKRNNNPFADDLIAIFEASIRSMGDTEQRIAISKLKDDPDFRSALAEVQAAKIRD